MSLLLVLLSAVAWRGQALCNYIYSGLDTTAWATGTCMLLSTQTSPTKLYVMYRCTGDESKPVVVETFHTNDCSGPPLISQDFRTALPATNTTSNETDMHWQCGGDNCYVAYMENCHVDGEPVPNEKDQRVVYSPADTCVRTSSNSSYKITCTRASFTYFSFNNPDCTSPDDSDPLSRAAVETETVLSCRDVPATGVALWYNQCKMPTSPPTPPVPSVGPSPAPTPAPSAKPTRFPTFDIPFYNMSPSELDAYLEEITGEERDEAFPHPAAMLALVFSAVAVCALLD